MNFQKWISSLLVWLQTADRANVITVVICGVALAFAVALTIHWAKARYRAANIAVRNSQRIAARHYHERCWTGW